MESSDSLAAEIHALSHIRIASPGPEGAPMIFDCAMTSPPPPGQYAAARRHADLPAQMLEFWSITDELILFVDLVYGQDGLRLLGPQEAAIATVKLAEEWRDTDRGPLTAPLFVIGRFIGDGDRLALHRDTGQIVCLPEILALDECQVVAPSLREFLTAFRSFAGERYWEPGRNRALMGALQATGTYGNG